MQKVKERLFGFVVVLSLGIIFAPMFFTQENKKLNLTNMQMNDPTPNMSVASIEEPETLAQLNLAQTLDESAEAGALLDTKNLAQYNINVKTGQKNTLTQATQVTLGEMNRQKVSPNVAWAVQLGTFKNNKNAEKLAVQLQKDGFKAFTKEIQGKTQPYTLVLVGPKVQKKEAATLKQALGSKYNLQGIIVQHQPVIS